MSSSSIGNDWNFRIFGKRQIIVKNKNEKINKIAVLDVLTNLAFAIEVSEKVSIDSFDVGREYLANLEVYTSKNLDGVDKDFINFFEALDIDQSMDDFIKAYWVYPGKIKFKLIEVEPT
jgi:hypothetical protein